MINGLKVMIKGLRPNLIVKLKLGNIVSKSFYKCKFNNEFKRMQRMLKEKALLISQNREKRSLS